MTEDRWQRVKALLRITGVLPPSEGAAFNATAVNGYYALRRGGDALLRAETRTDK